MRKIILILFCILCLNNVSAQYFIPLFDPIVDSMGNCHLMISDSTVDYLYFFMSDSSGVSNAYTYRDNQVQLVNQSTYYQNNFEVGTTTQSGKLIVRHHLDQINEIDSLNFQNCFYGFCNMPVNKAIISRNDTIFFNEGFTVRFLAPDGSTSVIGVSTGVSGVNDLEFYNGHLYASGTFTAMDGNTASKYICWWDGNNWHPVNQAGIVWGVSIPGIQSMLLYDNKLIGGGNIDSVNGESSALAIYDGSSWLSFPGIKAYSSAVEDYHAKLYFIGSIIDTNNILSGLAYYNGDNTVFNYAFPPMGVFLTSAVFDDTLFIGGYFDHINYVPAQSVAKFVDGTFSSFAPVGTKWWYNSSDTAYKYYEVARDTFIMHSENYYGYNCRKITGEHHEHDSTVTQLAPLYVFGDTNRVMYYNNSRGRFVPLYNFNISTGDTLIYYTPQPQTISDTTFRVVVDSITQLNVQGTNCKRVWSTPLDNWSFGNDGYVQLIGGMGSMLPQLINYFNTEGPLRCYEDTSVFYHYLVTINCEQLDTATGISEQLIVNSYQLTVSTINENSIAVNILTTRSTAAELLIYNMQGQLVSSKNITLRAGENHFTQPTPYAQGMYLLQVRTKSEVRNVKFVRE